MLNSILFFILAAFAEIGGCFAFWQWSRNQGPTWVMLPGIVCLITFALLLTRIDSEFAGRTYAAYGGVYITASIFWLWFVEKKIPDVWDFSGMLICLIGTCVILFAPRNSIF